jgi:hypothetical protein
MAETEQTGAESDGADGTKKTVEFKFDGNVGNSLQAGFGALQQVFEGFAKMAQNAIGPELVKNLQAGGWLGSVADTLDAIAASNGSGVPGAQAGELACYIERLESELTGSKFAPQLGSFRNRLESAAAATERAMQSGGGISREDAQIVAAAAGYFRASAKSVISIGGGNA